MRIAVAAARFNPEITGRLHQSCLDTLRRRGLAPAQVDTLWVPGAYELPWAAHELARSRRYDAVIAIGCILKGQTPQNDHIAAAVARALQDVAVRTRMPVVFGVITPLNARQAAARTRGDMDRGREAAEVALQMARLKTSLRVAGSALRVPASTQPAARQTPGNRGVFTNPQPATRNPQRHNGD